MRGGIHRRPVGDHPHFHPRVRRRVRASALRTCRRPNALGKRCREGEEREQGGEDADSHMMKVPYFSRRFKWRRSRVSAGCSGSESATERVNGRFPSAQT